MPGSMERNRRGLAPRSEVVVLDLDHRDHAALVILVGAVDVEEFQPGPLGVGAAFAAGQGFGDDQVEGVLAPAVEVERAQTVEGREVEKSSSKPSAPDAVGGGGGGVDEA